MKKRKKHHPPVEIVGAAGNGEAPVTLVDGEVLGEEEQKKYPHDRIKNEMETESDIFN